MIRQESVNPKYKKPKILNKDSNKKLNNGSLMIDDGISVFDSTICQGLQSLSINNFHSWQLECLKLNSVLNGGKSLIYSAPTSAGKSLVADIIMASSCLRTSKKSILILPYVSIVMEKVKTILQFTQFTGLKVAAYYGSMQSPRIQDVDIAICTIEKANGILNRLLEDNEIHLVGCVVVDELHILGDPNRGYLLELLLAKILISQNTQNPIQIVGMSATIPNIEILSTWLNATLYITDYRPVPLNEYIKIGDSLYDADQKLVRKLTVDPKQAEKLGDADYLVPLIYETISQGHSVLVFCATKKECENATRNVTRLMIADADISTALVNARQLVIDEMRIAPGGMEDLLAHSIMLGFAFHHAGLTTEERNLIEDAYRRGILSCLFCTSTVASGVNLPARRVIFRSPYIGKAFLSTSSYKQMCGRAGRKGFDEHGESILMVREKDKLQAFELMKRELNELHSCLNTHQSGLDRAILEVVGAGRITNQTELKEYLSLTLVGNQLAEQDLLDSAQISVQNLVQNGFVVEDDDGNFKATILASATLASGLAPNEALLLAKEISRDIGNFCLKDDFHAVYHVTPLSGLHRHNWVRMMDIYNVMQDNKKHVADLIGIQPAYLQKLAQGGSMKNGDIHQIHERFFNALILFDLLNEVPFVTLIEKYDINRGALQSMQQVAASFSGMVSNFCRGANLKLLECIIRDLQGRLSSGVESDLIGLCQIPHVERVRARLLQKAGLETPEIVAKTDIIDIFKALKSIDAPDNIIFKVARQIQFGAKEYVENGRQ